MAFEQFPYTNLHDLNLDWLLKTVKDTKDILDNTDIPQHVRDELTVMYNDGRLEKLVNEKILADIQAKVDANTESIGTAKESIAANAEAIGNLKVTATLAMLSAPDAVSGDPDRGFSLCMVIHNKDFCVVYDHGNDSANRLLEYLRQNGVKKITAFVGSHYHSDHCTLAGVTTILNSGIPVEKWYLPNGAVSWDAFKGVNYQAVQTSIKNAITAAGGVIVEPATEGMMVQVSKAVYLEFYNVAAPTIAGYYNYTLDEDLDDTGNTNYNNFSMCARLRVGDKILALTGDIEEPAQDKMFPIVQGVDVLQLPHHGIDLRDSRTFIRSMGASVYLTAAYGVARFYRLQYLGNAMLHRAIMSGTSLSTLGGKTIEMVFGYNGCYVTAPGAPTPIGTFGESIPAGSDFNDYREIGFAGYVQNASVAAQVANMPSPSGGRLWVIASNQNSQPHGSLMQIFTPAFSYAHPELSIRMLYDDDWKPWKTFKTAD